MKKVVIKKYTIIVTCVATLILTASHAISQLKNKPIVQVVLSASGRMTLPNVEVARNMGSNAVSVT
jgi:hypothetical protein